jgi:hypothetical protein
VRGRAKLDDDPAARQGAIGAAGYTPKDRYILFVLDIDTAFMNVYDEDNQPTVRRWQQQTDPTS